MSVICASDVPHSLQWSNALLRAHDTLSLNPEFSFSRMPLRMAKRLLAFPSTMHTNGGVNE
jgi:hypothetical protein